MSTATVEPSWAAFAAIDWGDRSHAWSLLETATGKTQTGQFPHTEAAVEAWASSLLLRFHGQPIAVGLEQSRGALLYLLLKYPHLTIFPIAPAVAARYRRTFAPSGAKSDPGDANSQLDLLLHHRDTLRPLQLDTVQTRRIQFLSEDRRRQVDDKTAYSNRLRARLKLYFPQILQWFEDPAAPLVTALLARWPTLTRLQSANPATLRKFFHQHNCRKQDLIDERIQAIYAAKEAIADEAVQSSSATAVVAWVAVIDVLRSNIADMERQLAELVAAHPNAGVFESFPGAGKVMVPRLIAAYGTIPSRFADADEMQRCSGIAPITIASGQTRHVQCRRACPKFLRQTFHEYAELSIQWSSWASAFYADRRHKKQSHHSIIRQLAYKWQRILHACWRDHTPYDEQRYLRALERRSSPLAAVQSQATGMEWKNVAGFQKISTKSLDG